jgi:hypothetical protein
LIVFGGSSYRLNCLTSSLFLVLATAAHGHLMGEQKGSLNFNNGGAFLVLSVPVSAFVGVDDDGDGRWSVEEFDQHTNAIKKQIYERVQLRDDLNVATPLQGLLLSLVHLDHNSTVPANQLMILGRFAVNEDVSSPSLYINLQGRGVNEKIITITATRGAHSQKMNFSITANSHTVGFNMDWTDTKLQ